jgi:HAD superfamily hydrolase (TIGR01549 family)
MNVNTNIHISFDLDGTLIDSIPLMKDSWENVNQKLNLKVGWDRYRANIGLHFDEICKNLELDYAKEEIKNIYFNYNKNHVAKIQLMPGVQDLLQSLAENNISWSILTSKPRYTAKDIVQHFDFKPSVIICSDDIKVGKPNPESAELLNKRLDGQHSFSTIYYVGDTIIDHIFSINAGFKFIQFRQYPQKQDNEIQSIPNKDGLILNPRPIIHSMDNLLSSLTDQPYS